MAKDAAKQLLDELMGRERDLGPDQKKATLDWSDPLVCKHYLVNFCPNSLFTNTKADIGPCNLVHDDYLKREYEAKASKRDKRAFEDEFIRICQAQLNEVDRKIKRAKQRLEMSQLEKSTPPGGGVATLSESNQEKLNSINEKIEKMLEEIEQLGCEGKVEEAQAAMKLLDKLKEEKSLIKRETLPGQHWMQQKADIGVAQEKQMEVCDVCGAFLIVNDVQQRVEDHLMGKQHVGFGRLKTAVDELVEKRKHDNFGLSSERDHHHRERKDFERFHSRDRDRRDRKKDRHKRHRSRTPDTSSKLHRWTTKDGNQSRERVRSDSFNGTTK